MTELAESAYALLTDGTEIEIRRLCPEDIPLVRRMHEGMSPDSLYLRFFSFSPSIVERVAERLCRPPDSSHGSLGAWLAGELVGVAGYEVVSDATAEIALAVADSMHHRGVGTLLLEHLGSLAKSRGIRVFRADALAQNIAMLRMASDAGLAGHRRLNAGVVEMRLSLDPDDRYLDAVAARESRADVASLTHLLRPAAVAVVGAGRHPGSVGHAILRSLRTCGFPGPVYAVNPNAGERLLGAPCVKSVADLPEAPELAIVAVRADLVTEIANACGSRGVQALVVVTSGLDHEQGRGLREACRRHGMRLVGPNCIGVVNTAVGLDSTFLPLHPVRGTAGVLAQSGGVGIALTEQLSRLGIGVSSFVSAGDKYDVSANDLLQWWAADKITTMGVLHVESFGNPRKFARTARRVGRTMPLLTVLAGRSAAGSRAAASHTAAAATPSITQEALFAQAGVIATRNIGELVATAALLATQPIPAGPRVAIVSNAGGAGVLAADACGDAGLTVSPLSDRTQSALAALLPPTAATANPVDLTAAVDADTYRRCLEIVATDPEVDSLIVVIAPTALSTLPVVPVAGDGEHAKPVVAVRLDQSETVTRYEAVPCYAFPEDAVRGIAHAWSYGRWLSRPTGSVPAFTHLRPEGAGQVISDFLSRHPEGGWLHPREAMTVLGAYGLPVASWRWAESPEEAIEAQRSLGQRVVLKAHVPGLIHKSAAGAVQLDLRSPAEVEQAYSWFRGRFGSELAGVVVQPMEPAGLELLCGVAQDPVFGPLVVFGLGGTSTDLVDRRTARLTPLTDLDAAEMLDALINPTLLPGAPRAAVMDVLLRLGRLADDHPQIAELDLNPIIVAHDQTMAVDARIRLQPTKPWDPYLRKLR